MVEWKDISTAPLDGSWVVVRSGDAQPCLARYNDDKEGWEEVWYLDADDLGYDEWPLTHWCEVSDLPHPQTNQTA